MKEKFYWTKEKEEELKTMWNNYPLYKLAAYFHTTQQNIESKAKELDLSSYKSNRWTKEEEDLLLEYSKKYVTKTIAKKLGRSYISVQKKAIKLGIELHGEVDPWKKWMIDYLKDNINKKPIGEIEDMLGLSYHRIITKCKELGIEYKKEGWTEEEIKILRENADKCHYTELTKLLPNRSLGAITAKAYDLGIQTISLYAKLDDEQIKYIKDNWGKMHATEIARNLKISLGILYRYKRQLGLPDIGQQKKWTEDVIENLRKDAKTKTRKQLAKKYKTSVQQISVVASKNNIKLINSRIVWTEEKDLKLKKMLDLEKSVTEISQELDVSIISVRNRMNELGLIGKIRKNKNRKVWKKEEEKLLKELVNKKTIQELALILNKTEMQVTNKIRILGLNLKNERIWSEEETKLLLDIYDKYEMHILSLVLERSESTISNKAKELGIFLKYKPRTTWTIEEEEKLIEYSKDLTINEISALLSRTTASVGSKLRYMGIKALTSPKFWSQEEIEKLITLSKECTIEELVSKMNKSYGSIRNKLSELGLNCVNTFNKHWTKGEEELLEELLTTYTSSEIAQILDRSEEVIIVKSIKLGYYIDVKHRNWTKEEEILLSDLWGNVSTDLIAKKLDRTVSAIKNRAYLLGLGSQISNNYDGIIISDIENIFKVNRMTILTSWVALGLKLSFRKRSDSSIYSYVEINDLLEFLEKNQNIWDSRVLERNIFGVEPDWLKEKRRRDFILGNISNNLDNLSKQQLLQAKKYFLSSEDNIKTLGQFKVGD